MKQSTYHGILVNMAFIDQNYPNKFSIFNKLIAEDWIIYGIVVDDIDKAIMDIQNNMRSDQDFYAHLYNDEDLIVVFKKKYFKATSHESSWKEIIEYGKKLTIPEEQLDFWPNRFQDEIHYFKKS